MPPVHCRPRRVLLDVVEKSFSSRLMKDRARSQAAPSGVPWPLGRPSVATFSFGLLVCLPAAPHNSRGMQIPKAISNGQEWVCGFFTYTASFPWGNTAYCNARCPPTSYGQSREVARHGGRPAYRANEADRQTWESALRPKPCLLAMHVKLQKVVAT